MYAIHCTEPPLSVVSSGVARELPRERFLRRAVRPRVRQNTRRIPFHERDRERNGCSVKFAPRAIVPTAISCPCVSHFVFRRMTRYTKFLRFAQISDTLGARQSARAYENVWRDYVTPCCEDRIGVIFGSRESREKLWKLKYENERKPTRNILANAIFPPYLCRIIRFI